MIWIIGLGLIACIFWQSNKRKKNQTPPPQNTQALNRQWSDFIAAYYPYAKTDGEKLLVTQMLLDLQKQGMPVPDLSQFVRVDAKNEILVVPVTAQAPLGATPAFTQPVEKVHEKIDNTSLLLYFGAFLLVASIGLYIAFGGAAGTIRTFAVLAVTVVLYSSGVWLHQNRSQLRAVGLTFSAMGLVTAPLVGGAIYAYILNKQHGTIIWFLTSLVCLTLYAHAVRVFRRPLLSYLFIFTFISLFESAVGVGNEPVYYFGWGLAFIGIVLQLLSRWKGYWPDIRESSKLSSQVILPVSLISAVYFLPKHGAIQLGISLLLAALFYTSEMVAGKDPERLTYAVAGQSLFIAGSVAVIAGTAHTKTIVVSSLIAVNLLQLLVVVSRRAKDTLAHNFATVLLLSSLAAVLLSLMSPVHLLVGTGGLALIGLSIWIKQNRAEVYGVAVLAWTAIPYIYGQLVAPQHLSGLRQTLLGLLGLAVVFIAYRLQAVKARRIAHWSQYASASYSIAAVTVAVASTWASPIVCLAAAVGIVISMVSLAEFDNNPEWAECAAIFLLAPLIQSATNKHLFFATVSTSLVILIGLALRYRRESLRWVSTALWLVLPFAIGQVWQWDASIYAYAYFIALLGLILSRAIALGTLLFSDTLPLVSYMRTASISYVAGYSISASLAIGFSLSSNQSRIHTSIILALMMIVVVWLSRMIEKRDELLILLIVLSQGLLASVIRPAEYHSNLIAYLVLSTTLALVSYITVERIGETRPHVAAIKYGKLVALLTAFITPLSLCVGIQVVWPMPFGLLFAGVLASYQFRIAKQAERELIGGIISLAVMWLLGFVGVRQEQVYVHVILVTLLWYAYWRYQKDDHAGSDAYIWVALLTATIPLTLQALGSHASGLYALWLLLEQVVIMLVGMSIKRSFVIRWGLYTALGTVLYELRSLGYFALAVLAVFLISLAVYRIQKHPNPK